MQRVLDALEDMLVREPVLVHVAQLVGLSRSDTPDGAAFTVDSTEELAARNMDSVVWC